MIHNSLTEKHSRLLSHIMSSGAHASMTREEVLRAGKIAINAHLKEKVGKGFYRRARLIKQCAYDDIIKGERAYRKVYNVRKFMLNTSRAR